MHSRLCILWAFTFAHPAARYPSPWKAHSFHHYLLAEKTSYVFFCQDRLYCLCDTSDALSKIDNEVRAPAMRRTHTPEFPGHGGR